MTTTHSTGAEEPLREVWVVSTPDGPEFVAPYRQAAMEHASIMAGDFPELGPYRVCKYVAEPFATPPTPAPQAAEFPSFEVDGPEFDAHFAERIDVYADKHPMLLVRQLARRLRTKPAPADGELPPNIAEIIERMKSLRVWGYIDHRLHVEIDALFAAIPAYAEQCRAMGGQRVLHESDSHCPSCGHNRDTSSVSTIHDLMGGTSECQMCRIKWHELPAPPQPTASTGGNENDR